MKKLFVTFTILSAFLIVACATTQKIDKKEAKKAKITKKSGFDYPKTERKVVKDNYFGTVVEDPYRWLENSKDPKVVKWTEAQNEFTTKHIFSYSQTNEFYKILKKLWKYDKMLTPVKRGNLVFYRFKKGLQNQPNLFVKENGKERLLIDLNKIDKEGTTAMDWWYVSPKGKYIAYGLSKNGSEQSVLHIMDVTTQKEIDSPISGCRYASVGWLPDESGFFYTKKVDGNDPKQIDMAQTIRFHKIGDAPKNDKIIAKSTIKEAILVSTLGNNGKWLLIFEYKGSSGKARVTLYDVENQKEKVVADNFNNIYEGEIYNDNIYLKTAKDNALNWKIVKVNCDTLEWSDFVAEDKNDVIDSYAITKDNLVVSYMHDVASMIKIFNFKTGEAKEIKLPVLGSVHSLSGNPDSDDFFISFSSYGFPPAIFHYTPQNGLEKYWQAKIPAKTDNIITKQVFYKSKDGTKIPMFIVYKKGIKLNGKNHTMIKGYGGFNVVYPLYFSSTNLAWLETGGILAIANIRGGGEYGEKWHRAGMLDKKQNCFDDFAGALKYLIENKYTNPSKIAIWGGSNGGLLTGAMVTQYPKLFKVALVAVPLLDMLRFQKFLIGRYWVSEYGSSDNKEQFQYLIKYSPYQNVKKGTKYPAVLLTAGDHDSRVHPMHAKKMAAELQYANASKNPIFLWVERKAGHGQGKSTEASMKEAAMEYGFFLHELGVSLK